MAIRGIMVITGIKKLIIKNRLFKSCNTNKSAQYQMYLHGGKLSS